MRKMMKKDILVFGSLLFLMSVSGAALAQNCTNPARCDELGYIFSAEDCEGIRSLICPFDSSKYFCDDEDPAAGAVPGMILYSDRTVSNDVVSGKTAVGVVAYVSGPTRFAVALEESSSTLLWSTPSYENLSCLTDYDDMSSAQTDFNGATNTSCIINYSSSNSYPAAEYCNTYKPVSSGKSSSGWYLAINTALNKLSKTQLSANYYWSSSECSTNSAWNVIPSNGKMNDYSKNYNSVRVRCFLAF